MKISELALAAGTSKDTVRHYVDLGLLKAHKHPENGYQLFDELALNRLIFIKMARGLGLSLQDIQQIFSDEKNAKSPCPRVRHLMEQRIAATRQRIVELNALCERMEKAMDEWRDMPDSVPNGKSLCKLIESQWTESHREEKEGTEKKSTSNKRGKTKKAQ